MNTENTKHTPGPWEYHSRAKYVIVSPEDTRRPPERICKPYSEANARRIVACVNACDKHGLATEDLEKHSLADVVMEQLLKTDAQRDELLAALERAERAMSNVAAVGIPEALDVVRAAIAKAKP